MSSPRVVQILRRLSNSDSRIKNNVNQIAQKDCLTLSNKSHDTAEIVRSARFLSSPQLHICDIHFRLPVKSSSSEILFRNMASTSSNQGSTKTPKFTNRLSNERSPYLLQHAHNPVDWFPWGDEAIAKAKKENKLIFLSVGYSTCHWCHVMEKESFENESVAIIMNEHYVNIKVDREERPDIDKTYMLFVQATTGGGGWPMSVFLTPDLNPVTGGTYFPPEDKYGRRGFKSILSSLAERWAKNPSEFVNAGKHIIDVLKNFSTMQVKDTESETAGEEAIKTCIDQFKRNFEPDFGGFGEAPKFPQSSNFNFLLHAYARNKSNADAQKCLDMCLYTLRKMANGGIHDHVSSGFARYSVDRKWHVPHFEKMLYDQAQLVIVYTDAYLASKDEFFAEVACDILKYVTRDLSHESGGFYSAEDADSYPVYGAPHKAEGAFCVWEYSEIESLLNDKIIETGTGAAVTYCDIFCHHFSVGKKGNIGAQSDPHGELTNKNVLIVYGSLEETAEKYGITTEKLSQILEKCRALLYDERQKRPRPHLDSKILCSWNGLMIAAFARAGQSLANKTYTDRAIEAANFIKKYLYDEGSGTLLRSCYRDDSNGITQISKPINGFLDDYAFLIMGLLDLYEATFDTSWLQWAVSLQDKQDELFWDNDNGAYFSSPVGDPSVILRLKEDQDGAEPSGNSISLHNALRLSALAPDHDSPTCSRKARALKILIPFSERLRAAPMALPEMSSALMSYLDSPTQVFIAGASDDPRTLDLVRVVRSRLLPARVIAVADPAVEPASPGMSEILLSRIKLLEGVPAAYVCRRFACSLPVTEPTKLEEILDE